MQTQVGVLVDGYTLNGVATTSSLFYIILLIIKSVIKQLNEFWLCEKCSVIFFSSCPCHSC